MKKIILYSLFIIKKFKIAKRLACICFYLMPVFCIKIPFLIYKYSDKTLSLRIMNLILGLINKKHHENFNVNELNINRYLINYIKLISKDFSINNSYIKNEKLKGNNISFILGSLGDNKGNTNLFFFIFNIFFERGFRISIYLPSKEYGDLKNYHWYNKLQKYNKKENIKIFFKAKKENYVSCLNRLAKKLNSERNRVIFFMSSNGNIESNVLSYIFKENVLYIHDFDGRPNLFIRLFKNHIDISDEQYKWCKNNLTNQRMFLIRLPVFFTEDNIYKRKAFKYEINNLKENGYVILFTAAPYHKIKSKNNDFLNIIIDILKMYKNIIYYLFTDDKIIANLERYFKNKTNEKNILSRIKLYKIQPTANILKYIDIYISSFPVPGGTLDKEVMANKIPVLYLKNKMAFKSIFKGYPNELIFENKGELLNNLKILIEDKKKRKEIGNYCNKIVNQYCAEDLIREKYLRLINEL